MEIDVLAGTVQPVDKTIAAKAQERFDNLITVPSPDAVPLPQ